MILPLTIKNADVINPLCALTSIVIMFETHSLYQLKKGYWVGKDAFLNIFVSCGTTEIWINLK